MLIGLLKRLHDDSRGSVAIVFGLSIVVLLLGAGAAIDSARVYNIRTKVQSALDAASLAGAKLLESENLSDSEISATAQKYFASELEHIGVGQTTIANFRAVIDRTASSVTAQADVHIATLLAQLGGNLSSFDFTPTSTVVYKSKKIELALVVDVTGSMGASGKMDALKGAAKQLVDALFTASPLPGAVRVSLIPYSASVNAGGFYDAATNGGAAGAYTGWSGWSGWGASATDTCVVERAGAEAYTDTPPGAGGYLGTSNVALNPRYSCPSPTVVPLSDLSDSAVRTSFKNSIDALTPSGATAGHIGAAWGWYSVSPRWSSFWPASAQPKPASPDVMKIVILMTDGEFNTSYDNGAVNSTNFADVGSSGYQALQLCDGMKAEDITVYTVAFMSPGNAEAMMRQCSGPANFYSAETSGDLFGAFQDIVDKLTNLRISS